MRRFAADSICHRFATAGLVGDPDGADQAVDVQQPAAAMPRRAPVAPPRAVAATLAAAARDQQPVALLEGMVTAYPPSGSRGTWRVVYRLDDRRIERSAGRTPAHVWAAALAAHDDLVVAIRPRAGTPVGQLVEAYLRQHAGRWDDRTVHDRRTDLGGLARFGAAVPCVRLDGALLQRAVDACGTPRRAEFVRRRIRHLLAWGVKHDYLTAEQLALVERVEWTRPDGWRDAPTRRVLAARAGLAEVPGIEWTSRFGLACADRDRHGQAIVEIDAVTGLRWAELMVLTADRAVAAAGEGNLVDLDAAELVVVWQLANAGDAATVEPSKSGRPRRVVVPAARHVPSGFNVRAWLTDRVQAAQAEQAAGANPRALIFPGPGGDWWRYSTFRSRVTVPALTALKVPRFAVPSATGRPRRLWQYTFHSLRDRYAVTAIERWGYTKAMLLAQGCWTDMTTVDRYYHGVTDDTHAQVRAALG